MKSFKKYLIVFTVLTLIYSCSKDNNEENNPVLRDYATQYNEDIIKIEDYLKTHSVTVINHSGFIDDQDAIFNTVPSLDAESIWGSNPDLPKATLLNKQVTIGGVVHKIYYLKFRDGIGASPTIDNQIKSYYKAFFLDDMVFDTSPDDGFTSPLNKLIYGWREILPEFKMGTITGVNQYENFGAGVMFLPSALAFYNDGRGEVPPYTPLVYSFKLYNVI